MVKYYCVSDVHSFYDQLLEALNQKKFDINNPEDKLIICGDAFDRGDQSIKLFDFMKKLASEDRLIYVLGNHEDLLFDCIEELTSYCKAGGHHYHNNTIKTISHFIGGDDYWIYSSYIPSNIINDINERTRELRDFIIKNGINYFTLGNKIFVHSWIPTYLDFESSKDVIWNGWETQVKESSSLWKKARWGNPFEQWKQKLYPENKCIVFGHWHCSWGHSHIDMKEKEWPQCNQKERFEASFKPWIKDNAIGIDSCCAYSGKINCLVFDQDGNLIEC